MPYFPEIEKTVPLFVWFIEAMELFVVAHEYAHVFREHVRTGSVGSEVDPEQLSMLREMEFDADSDAIAILSQDGFSNSNPISRSSVGATLVLSCVEAMFRAAKILRVSPAHNAESLTHPSNDDRFLRVLKILETRRTLSPDDQAAEDEGILFTTRVAVMDLFKESGAFAATDE